MNKAILSILGRDRPGIVAAVARVLFEQGCNIENVSQTMLQSEFAGIFIVSLPHGLAPKPARALSSACRCWVCTCTPRRASRRGARAAKPSEPFVITTRGPDRKGLVADVTQVIARYGVNITNLQAVFKGGEDPGDNIMIYEVDVPLAIDPRRSPAICGPRRRAGTGHQHSASPHFRNH